MRLINKSLDRYKVNKRTNILKNNPNKKDIFGDIGTDVVGVLNAGEIIDVVKTSFGGRGAIPTTYLFLSNDTYIIGSNADLIDKNKKSKIVQGTEQKPNELSKNNTLLILGLLALGFLAYKQFKK